MTLLGPVEMAFAVGVGTQTPLGAHSVVTGTESWVMKLCITSDQRLEKMSAITCSGILLSLLAITDVSELY